MFVYFPLVTRFPQLQFEYRDPEKHFDRSRVHGLVAKLIKIKEVSTATALEVAAGGKVCWYYLIFYVCYINNVLSFGICL